MSVRVFAGFLALRIFFAVITSTTHVPDETWQTVEIAHSIAFGYGYRTWEWREGLRTFLYPLLFVPCLAALEWAGLAGGAMLVVAPRMIQGLISAIGDLYIYKFCRRKFGASPSRWFLLIYGSNWFVNYCSSRTLINAVEAAITNVALYFYDGAAQPSNRGLSNSAVYVTLISVGFVLRPTVAIFWLPLVVTHAFRLLLSGRVRVFFMEMVPAAAVVLAASTAVDSLMYGNLEVVPWNFFRVNVLSGVAAHYGVHPFHWYLSQGLLVAFGLVCALPFVNACLTRAMVDNCIFAQATVVTIALYSCLGHKEFRFLLPIVPLGCCFVAEVLARRGPRRDPLSAAVPDWMKVALILVLNIPPAIYFSVVHQSGGLAVIEHLRQTAPTGASVLILMPCHSTPHQSHLHRPDIDLRFLTCEPNLTANIADPGGDSYADEADEFYAAPEKWLASEHSDPSALPSRVVLYDVLQERIRTFLDKGSYEKCGEFFHTHITEGRTGELLVVYCRRK